MTAGLLLLHAFPLDASMWEPQASALGADVHVVAPNFPGFGGASEPLDVLTMDAAADAAASSLSAAGVDRALVCGLSMGGYAALAFWRRHRDRVAGLVLANTRAGADDDAGRERRRALAERLRAEGSAFLVESPPPLLSASAPAELWDRVKAIIAAQPAAAIASASLGMAERPDSTGDLAGIDVPVLVVTSSGDTLIPPEASTPMVGQIPGARLEVLEGAGHLSNLERPPAFSQLLREELQRTGILSR
jgi:pimeloyl-ACP methyl ester carboxylesterase